MADGEFLSSRIGRWNPELADQPIQPVANYSFNPEVELPPMTTLQRRAIELLNTGMKTREVVTALGCSADTVRRAAAAYRAQGGALPHRRRGGPSILGAKLPEAVGMLRAGPAANGFPTRPGNNWMLPEVRKILREKYQVEYRGWLRAWCERPGIATSANHYVLVPSAA